MVRPSKLNNKDVSMIVSPYNLAEQVRVNTCKICKLDKYVIFIEKEIIKLIKKDIDLQNQIDNIVVGKGETETTDVTSPTTESISGTATNQRIVNEEVVEEIGKIENGEINFPSITLDGITITKWPDGTTNSSSDVVDNSDTNPNDGINPWKTQIDQNTTDINNIENELLNLETENLLISSPTTESISGVATNQRIINEEVASDLKEIEAGTFDYPALTLGGTTINTWPSGGTSSSSDVIDDSTTNPNDGINPWKKQIDQNTSDINDIEDQLSSIETSTLDISSPTTESLSGTAANQEVVNEEVVDEINKIEQRMDECGCPINNIPYALITINSITNVSTDGGSDGSINFNVEVVNFTGVPTAVLNPSGGKEPIMLVEGDNNNLVFDTLTSGYYEIIVYDDETIITSKDNLQVKEPDEDNGSLTPLTPDFDPPNNGGSTDQDYVNYPLIFTLNNINDDFSTGYVMGDNLPINEECGLAIRSGTGRMDIKFTDNTTYEIITNTSIYSGITWMKGSTLGATSILADGDYSDSFTLDQPYNNSTLIIIKTKIYGNTINKYEIFDTKWISDNDENNLLVDDGNKNYMRFTSDTNATLQMKDGNLVKEVWAINPQIDDVVIDIHISAVLPENYSDYDFLILNYTRSGNPKSWLMWAKDVIQDNKTKYFFSEDNKNYFTIDENNKIHILSLGADISYLREIKGIKMTENIVNLCSRLTNICELNSIEDKIIELEEKVENQDKDLERITYEMDIERY